MIMTTKEKIKAFIQENAKYKVGQEVYFYDHDRICMATVTCVRIDCDYLDFFYHGGKWNNPLGREAKLYGSFGDARYARCVELDHELARLAALNKDDAVLWDDCEDEWEDECGDE